MRLINKKGTVKVDGKSMRNEYCVDCNILKTKKNSNHVILIDGSIRFSSSVCRGCGCVRAKTSYYKNKTTKQLEALLNKHKTIISYIDRELIKRMS